MSPTPLPQFSPSPLPQPPPPPPRFKRGNYLINPGFQLRLIGMMLIPICIAFAIFYVSMQLLLANFLAQLREMILPEETLYSQFVADQQTTLRIIFITTLFLVLFAMLLGSLIVSHRVAGPLYRLRTHLREIAQGGPLKELKFRDGDYLHEVVPDYNAAMRRLYVSSPDPASSPSGLFSAGLMVSPSDGSGPTSPDQGS